MPKTADQLAIEYPFPIGTVATVIELIGDDAESYLKVAATLGFLDPDDILREHLQRIRDLAQDAHDQDIHLDHDLSEHAFDQIADIAQAPNFQNSGSQASEDTPMKMTITITGPCQCGKTKLAHRIAKMLRENDIPRDVQVIDDRHLMDDEDSPPMIPKRLKLPVEIHVSEPFPPQSIST